MSEHAQPAGAGTEAIRIVLVDDHTVMRAGTRRILEDEADFRVVGEAADGEEALRLARTHTPDVVVLDIALPGMDGVKVCQVLRAEYPGMRVMILTGHDTAALVRTLHALGAAGSSRPRRTSWWRASAMYTAVVPHMVSTRVVCWRSSRRAIRSIRRARRSRCCGWSPAARRTVKWRRSCI